jgi:peroxiredoxin
VIERVEIAAQVTRPGLDTFELAEWENDREGTAMSNLLELPPDLPVPQDDGAADHLVGLPAPHVSLPSTTGETVALDNLGPGRTILFVYPMTGQPGVELPEGWDAIPGARGCTSEACDFGDRHADLLNAGASHVFGLSARDIEYQQEAATRLLLPYALLSDVDLQLAQRPGLPTFEAGTLRLFKRLTLIIRGGVIEHVFYPVFPPNEHAAQVLAWLHAHPAV